MGAVVWHDVLGQMDRSGHGSTFGGNPLACASAIAAIRTLQEENIPEHVAALGEWFMGELEAMDLPQVREIRGAGLMIGLELRGRVTPVLKELQDRGFLALPAGATTLRFLPPLIITQEELQRVLDVLPEVLS